MKAILTFLASTILCLSSLAEEKDPMQFSARGDLNRAKTYFNIVKHLDSKESTAAETLFRTILNTNGCGGIFYDRIALHLSKQEYDLARDLCICDIDFWIIDTAADWQVPALTALLDDPDRLRFLQDLAAHRKKFPARTADGRKSEALVVDILQKANERRK